jgi:hypothetical protein
VISRKLKIYLHLILIIKIVYLYSQNGHFYRNMQHVLTRLIKFVVVDGSAYVSCNKNCHNGTHFTTKKKSFRLILYPQDIKFESDCSKL